MKYLDLSQESKETIKGMVEFCINNAIGMGMDEGFNADDSKKEFRKQLELFIEAKIDSDNTELEAKLKAEYMEGYETGILQNANKYFPRLQGGYDGSVD